MRRKFPLGFARRSSGRIERGVEPPKLDHGASSAVRTNVDEANESHPRGREALSRLAFGGLESLCVLVCGGLRRLWARLPDHEQRCGRTRCNEHYERVGECHHDFDRKYER